MLVLSFIVSILNSMKIFIKLLILIVILACGAPFFLKGPDGKVLLDIENIKSPVLSIWNSLEQTFESSINSEHKKSTELEVYKWVDKQGVTHYSDKNDNSSKAKLTEIKAISVLPLQKTRHQETINASDNSVGLTTIPLQNIPKLIDDTKQVKKVMEERNQQIERALP